MGNHLKQYAQELKDIDLFNEELKKYQIKRFKALVNHSLNFLERLYESPELFLSFPGSDTYYSIKSTLESDKDLRNLAQFLYILRNCVEFILDQAQYDYSAIIEMIFENLGKEEF